ncbi:MAG TPA: hypothetical protein VL523_09000 [Terriglobia bacterium]|nr:hypothetical protein [Terriglobia bacterium]
MSGDQPNGAASAEDFQSAARLRGEPEQLVLPKSGLKVMLRRPSPMWFLFRGLLPASLAARAEGGQPSIDSVQDLRALAEWMVPLLREVFVQPRLTLEPGPCEISPDLLDVEDANFVIRWAVGEVASAAGDLASFREQRTSFARGAGGRNLALPAE